MTIANSLRRVARRGGLDVQRATPFTMPMMRLAEMLRRHGVETVLDVGANDGGYASELIEGGYTGKIVSFEPLPEAHQALLRRSARHPHWSVGPRVALSDKNGLAIFHEAANSVSSSLLTMTETHTRAAPNSATLRDIEVQTMRLDTVIDDYHGPVFLKLDVQGAERLVLDGAGDALRDRIIGVQLEMSLAELYLGQGGANNIDAFLCSEGFVCWDMLPGFRDHRTFRMLQYDGIYFR